MIIKGFAFVAAEHSGGRYDRTSAQRPPPPPCGRQCCPEEGRRPPGSYPPDRPLYSARAPAEANKTDKLPATGRWRTK